MSEHETKSGDWKMILGGVLLIAALFVGIKFIFWGLERAVPRNHAGGNQSISASQSAPEGSPAPSFCIHCGKGLPESFAWGQFCPYCGEKVE